MRPWNPHSQTFHGEPIVGQVPVRLVVRGPDLTPRQGAMLQAAYASFASGARLSVAANPSAQGTLPDGSRYAIECVNGVCACTVWPVGGVEGEQISSGITMPLDGKVIVNRGAPGAPSSKWVVQDGLRGDLATEKRAPYGAGIFSNTSVVVGGKQKYFYRGGDTGRYGKLFISTWSPQAPYAQPAGLTRDRRAFVLIDVRDGVVRLGVSTRRDAEIKFPDPQDSSPAYILAPADEGTWTELARGSEGGGAKTSIPDAWVDYSRDGRNVLWKELLYSDKVSPSDVLPGLRIRLRRKSNIRVVDTINSLGLRGIFMARPLINAPLARTQYKTTKTRVGNAIRTDDTYSLVAGYTPPDDEISSVDEISGFYDPSDESLRHSSWDSSVKASGKSGPGTTYTRVLIVNEYGDWRIDGGTTTVGPIAGRIERQEKIHDVSPHFFGGAKVVLLTTEEFDYVETMAGNYERILTDGRYADGPASEPIPPMDTLFTCAANHVTIDITQNINATLRQNKYVTLNNGEKLYLHKYLYNETSTFASQYSWTTGTWEDYTENSTISYSLERESRFIYVYDPENDLLCYQEIVYSAQKSQEYESFTVPGSPPSRYYSHAGGGGHPDVNSLPPEKTIIRCRGVTIEVFALPATDMGLLPAVGIAPEMGPTTASSADTNFFRTEFGFARWHLSVVPATEGAAARTISVGPPSLTSPIGDLKNIEFRGLIPNVGQYAAVRYVKAPETGAAHLRIEMPGRPAREFVVDGAGCREFRTVFPDLQELQPSQAF